MKENKKLAVIIDDFDKGLYESSGLKDKFRNSNIDFYIEGNCICSSIARKNYDIIIFHECNKKDCQDIAADIVKNNQDITFYSLYGRTKPEEKKRAFEKLGINSKIFDSGEDIQKPYVLLMPISKFLDSLNRPDKYYKDSIPPINLSSNKNSSFDNS